MLTSQIKLQEAFAFYERGQLTQAKIICEELLMVDPVCADALHLLGIIEHQSNQHQLAVNLFNRAIAAESNRPAFYANRANALLALSRFDEAIQNYDQAISIKPDFADVYFNRGNALLGLQQIEAAINSYTEAINTNPNFAQAFSNRGNALQMLKRFSEAAQNYDRAISIDPNYANAYFNRGNALDELKQFEKAVESYDQVIQLEPDYLEAHIKRANALIALNDLEKIVAAYDAILKIKPDWAEAYFNRGHALSKLKKLESAFESYTQGISIKQDYAQAYVSCGLVLAELGRFQEAIKHYDRAIALNPDVAESYAFRGVALEELKQLEEAIQSFEKSIALKPDFDYLLGTWLHCKMRLCDWNHLNDNLTEMIKRIEKGEKCCPLFPLLSLTDSLAVQKQATDTFANDRFLSNHELGEIPKRPRAGKIRIGYFSADFHFHPVSILLARLFELHDKSRFELIAFSLATYAHDAMRERVKNAFDQFIDVRHLPDKAVAQLAREMKIDIAVDLGGYTQNTRTSIFCYRAAPVQVNYLGYPATMGAANFDYLIADPIVIPPESQPYYAEKIVYLPQYQPNDETRLISEKIFTKKELGLPENGFVFCSLNHSYKINPEVFDGWMRILKAVPNSCLYLYADHKAVAQNLKKEAHSRGVDAGRLVFAGRIKERSEYLARFKVVDLFLDTFPYNAHATASDVLWAGLPLLTRAGESFASRVAASILNALDLPELITYTQKEYETLAIELTNNPAKLETIKTKLGANRLTTPLFDIKLYAKHIEAAYTQMVERYDAGLAPDHIYVKSYG